METQTTIANGLDTAVLSSLAESLRGDPAAGRVTFRSRSRWQDGARVFTRVSGFRVDGAPHPDGEREFVRLSDEPRELGATDTAPAPAEALMHAVASCLIATTNAYAALGGVRLTRLEVELEGEVDLHGIFGLGEEVRPGLEGLRATLRVAGDGDPAALRDVAQRGVRFSPIRDSVERGVPVRASVVVG